MKNRDKQLEAFNRLLNIMDELRQKCPWDKKQTFQSLRTYTLEEAYELTDAILEEDFKEVEKELGDLLMHLVFYSKMGSEKNLFDIESVCNAVCEKLIYRHPHIYGDVQVNDATDVNKNWELLKLKEGNESVLSGIPKSLPPFLKASRIQEKVRGIGFDWDNSSQVYQKVFEEIQELQEAVLSKNQEDISEEFGDVMFSLINYARFIGVDPETALEQTNKKFINRFTFMEQKIKEENKSFETMNLDQMDSYWNLAKEHFKKSK